MRKSHECSHEGDYFDGHRHCIRPAYRELDGKWWCETCYFRYSSAKTLGWCRSVINGIRCSRLATVEKESGNVCEEHK